MSDIRVGTLLGLLFAVVTASSVLASGDTLVRQPTFSSIPCRGAVTEFRTEEGNVHNSFSALFLICRSAPDRAQWIVRAAVGCDDGGDDNAPNTCQDPKAQPVGRFFQDQGGAHVYMLARYVFASDCASAQTAVKNMAPRTNLVRSSYPEAGWVCHQVNKVDGVTAETDDRVMVSSGFQYVRVTTRGSEETSSAEDQADATGENIFGTEDRDFQYQLTFHARGVVEK